MTRDEAVELVRKHDFLNFTGYTVWEFWDIVDRWYSREIFENVNGEWKLINPLK